MAHVPDAQRIRADRNTARFCVENPQIAWLLLLATIAWGIFGYARMPKRKDPEIPIRVAAVVCAWPGMPAETIEQRVTRRIEERLAENPNIEWVASTVRTSVSVTKLLLREVKDLDKELDDLKLKLDGVQGLPEGAGPVVFLKDFKDTTTLMLTVASPPADPVEVAVRARSVAEALGAVRAGGAGGPRVALVTCFPPSVDAAGPRRRMDELGGRLERAGLARDARPFERGGFVGLDVQPSGDAGELLSAAERLASDVRSPFDQHPDVWPIAAIREPAEAEARLAEKAGARYSYHDLDVFTERLQDALLASPLVAKVSRVGLRPEVIELAYSQERMAAYGVAPNAIRAALSARNIDLPGGVLDVGGHDVVVAPGGELASHEDLGAVMVAASQRGSPVYLRDLVQITRGYESPPRFLNAFTAPDATGRWRRGRAVTLSVIMHGGDQIARFGEEVDRVLQATRGLLPADLIVERTSDQPLQVSESIGLFTRSLWEAVILVVVIAFIGFREWRSATLIAVSIPLTLAMTFGMMYVLRVDLQSVSISSLIIALGLLVDDPVVAGDAIKREVAHGRSSRIAAWLGPTKLAKAIVFATLTNIAAYLPFLMLHDSVGDYLYALPVVLTCSLVASRVVSMTFVPLLGALLFRGGAPASAGPGRGGGARLTAVYRRACGWLLDHRKAFLAAAVAALALGAGAFTSLRTAFFPSDLQYLFYVDVWAPEDAALSRTARAAEEVEAVTRRVAEEYGRAHPGREGPRPVLRSLTTFVGGAGPRFWFSLSPEQEQLNYAQIVVQLHDKRDTPRLVPLLRRALRASLLDARADVRELETGVPVGTPVAIRFSGAEREELRRIAERAKGILRGVPQAEGVRDDWGAETWSLRLAVDADRANLSGVSNGDVALSAVAAANGVTLATLRERDHRIPVKLRMDPDALDGVDGIRAMTVHAMDGTGRVPLRQVATPALELRPEVIRRRNHFRTITVSAFPVEGALASEVMARARPGLDALARELPAGYRMEIGGESAEQEKGFGQVTTAMIVSVVLIYLVLAYELRSAVKPLVVYAAIPFGVVGALGTLWVAGRPFGFMAFLGIASLVGVIVSHVVVLFEFIEEAREEGRTLRDALLEAGIVRMRPVMVTVAATVIGLVPLARNGGPLWEPLCYAQIGGLTVATFVTLMMVPVLYAVFVLDLGIVPWERGRTEPEPGAQPVGGVE